MGIIIFSGYSYLIKNNIIYTIINLCNFISLKRFSLHFLFYY
ncbi:hypothetical protein EC24168_0402 [Escherichia coli 2.4168]|nr:hypothetical protein EC24168_0402 [Escherichia coli 2.4168]